jgi:cell wall-associated NlpC family hydrolase
MQHFKNIEQVIDFQCIGPYSRRVINAVLSLLSLPRRAPQVALVALALCASLPAAWANRVNPIDHTDAHADTLGSFLQQQGVIPISPDHNASTPLSQLVVHAMGFLGVPYRMGGHGFEEGVDCSAFVRIVYQDSLGLRLPRAAREQAEQTTPIEAADLQPGDLVFFNTLNRPFSHVGIYVGGGRFIHSPRSGATVRVEDMGKPYWQTRFEGARRVDSQMASSTRAGL